MYYKRNLFAALAVAACAIAATALQACTAENDLTDTSTTNNIQRAANSVRFNTYMATSATTRAGYQGGITTQELKDLDASDNHSDALTHGFGVFGYYTGTADYAQGTIANFMYNQQVYYDKTKEGQGYVTEWTYSPLKYWPNEVQDNAATPAWMVDDQDEDQSDNQAYTDGTHGGKVSFFAYAPYVGWNDAKTALKDHYATTDAAYGIIAINGIAGRDGAQGTPGTGSWKQGDPVITYVVNPEGAKVVDLLWGTAGNTSIGVTGAANAGQTHNATGTAYQQQILSPYTVNADLTKQKTTGTVSIAFKHALAKVGGSEDNSTAGATVRHGLLIQLDLDDQKGAEEGGVLESILTTDPLYQADQNTHQTKVTVSNVTITARSLTKDASDKTPGQTGYTATYLQKLEGQLNLATGQWTATGATTTDVAQAATTTHVVTQNASDANSAGVISSKIKEPTDYTGQFTTTFFKSNIPLGVLTTPQNVYENEAYPLVFIPGTWPELTATVTYTVRTLDENLAYNYSEVTQKITKKVTFKDAVLLNKQYSLLMHLGLTSVKFTATVDDWDNTISTTETGGTYTGVDEEAIEHIYIPRNVGETTTPGTETAITLGGKSYVIIFNQDGIPEGATYFSTEAPLTISAYELTNGGTRTKVTLDGTTNAIAVECRASHQHFHRGTAGEYVYTAAGDLVLTTQDADKTIIHAPVDITLTIGGASTTAQSTIYIWPKANLPYYLQ